MSRWLFFSGVLSIALASLYMLSFPDPVYAHHCGDLWDCFKTTTDAAKAVLGIGSIAILLSFALDVIPVVGTAKGIYEAITGKDAVTGEELEWWERAAGIIPVAGGAIAGTIAFSKIARHADDAADLSGSIRHSGDVPGSSSGIRSGSTRVGESEFFRVDSTMHAGDEAAGVLKNGVYMKNPTAQSLNDLVTETGKIGSKRMSGQYMYVVDKNGDITIGTRAGRRMPHPTLIGGADPQVRAAGIVDIRGGQIFSVDNASGHFKPDADTLRAAEEAFGKLPAKAFRNDFQGYRPFGE